MRSDGSFLSYTLYLLRFRIQLILQLNLSQIYRHYKTFRVFIYITYIYETIYLFICSEVILNLQILNFFDLVKAKRENHVAAKVTNADIDQQIRCAFNNECNEEIGMLKRCQFEVIQQGKVPNSIALYKTVNRGLKPQAAFLLLSLFLRVFIRFFSTFHNFLFIYRTVKLSYCDRFLCLTRKSLTSSPIKRKNLSPYPHFLLFSSSHVFISINFICAINSLKIFKVFLSRALYYKFNVLIIILILS